MKKEEREQRKHYDETYEDYVSHYDSPINLLYDQYAIYSKLLGRYNFNESKVLDVGCGSGQTSKYLDSLGAEVTGLDISPGMAKAFKKVNPQLKIKVGSARKVRLRHKYYDFIVVHTALHHMHPDVDEAIANLTFGLKPGGYFLFVEPHTDGFLDKIRQLWYRLDPRFEPNEAGINSEKLIKRWKPFYKLQYRKYIGNIVYFTVFQSYILRTPLPLRYFFFFFFFPVEMVINQLNSKHFSFLVIHHWRRR